MTSYTGTFPYVLFDIITRGTHSPDARVVTHPRLCVELIEQFRRARHYSSAGPRGTTLRIFRCSHLCPTTAGPFSFQPYIKPFPMGATETRFSAPNTRDHSAAECPVVRSILI
jgi:hypothetical protein